MRLRALILLFASALCAVAVARPLPVSGVTTPHVAPARQHLGTSSTQGADPLPLGCGRVTPPGQQEPACCISGFVYIDGQITAGAEVQVQSPRGDQVTLITQVFSGTETRPYYHLSLSAPPLNVKVGETISVTARYSGHERGLTYTVQPGGQQIDIVLPSNQVDDYVFERQLWGQANAGEFNYPRGIASDSAGNIYIVDTWNDRVQVFRSDGVFLRQWGVVGNQPGQFSEPVGIAIDMSNNVYVADYGNFRIQKFSSAGQWLTSWGSEGSGNGQFAGPQGLDVGTDSSIYVSDSRSHRIQKFSSTGQWLASWGSYGNGNGQFDGPEGVSVDANNNVYIADPGNDRIQKFSSSGQWLASWGGFSTPIGVSVDASGNVYVADTGNDRIQKFSSSGQWLASWGSYGSANGELNLPVGVSIDSLGNVYALENGNNRVQMFNSTGQSLNIWGSEGRGNGQFLLPEGVSVDASGNAYVADTFHHRIQKFSSSGQWLASWGEFGSGNGQFAYPAHLGVDNNGNIYVADTDNQRIQKLSSTGQWLASWGGFGSGDGQFNNPRGLAVDSTGNVYIADTGNSRIQKFSSTRQWLASWGGFGSGDGQFNNPNGVGVDFATGNIYVADTRNHRIQKFTATGGWLASWGGRGSSNSQFDSPGGVSTDSNGNVYVADTGNNRVQKFSGTGQWLASWGGFGSGDGQIWTNDTVRIDSTGAVYVNDEGNNRIQVFRPKTFTRPIATIVHLNTTSLSSTDILVAYGMGQDSDSTPSITKYRWTSDKDGIIGTSATLTRAATDLSPGTHRLTLEVQDGEGQWSDPASIEIYVAVPPQVEWTMLLYLAGDYHDRGRLVNSFTTSLDVLRQSFRNPYVRIAVQLDGPANGDTRRLLIEPGTATTPPKLTELAYGERAMDDPNVLTDFVRWGQSSFPAAHYYLAIANHGQAVQGIAWDSTTDPNDGAYLTVKELGQALRAPGVAPIDILHLDACSMNLLEVAYEVRQQVDILIASQYLGWGYFAYDKYQSTMGAATAPADVARGITRLYAAQAYADRYPYTIAALDLRRADPTLSAVDNLAAELAALANNNSNNRTILASIWQASQKFESNGDYLNNDLDMYIDLLDWANRIQLGISSPAVKAHAAALIAELTGPQPFILAGSNQAQSSSLPLQYANGAYIDLTNSHGLSIFYPRRQNTVVFDSYVNNRLFSFTSASRWPDFLIAGVGLLPPGPLDPAPGPLPPLDPSAWQHVFLPVLVR